MTVAPERYASTVSMMEPVFPLYLRGLGITPGRIGLVYGAAAVGTTLLHPLYGHAADRWGARQMTTLGMLLAGCVLPFVSRVQSFPSAIALGVLSAACSSMAITPSLAFMGEATSNAGVGSFGVAYGLYNLAWGAGLLGGPAAGGFLFERLGFTNLLLLWGAMLIVVAICLSRLQLSPAKAGHYERT